MPDAMLNGEHDPKVLARIAHGRMRAKIPQLQEALAGSFTGHHAFLRRELLDLTLMWTSTTSCVLYGPTEKDVPGELAASAECMREGNCEGRASDIDDVCRG